MHTFAVADVKPNDELLPETPLPTALEPRAGRVEAAGSNLPVAALPNRPRSSPFDGEQTGAPHPLFEAVHTAFASHFPLILSPDDIWLCIAQGFAHHVNQNAELLRERFVRHQGKVR